MHKPITREENLYIARIAEQSERYADMLKAMRHVVQANPNLTIEERDFLSVAYKNEVTHIRTAWRVLEKIAKKEEAHGMKYMHILQTYQDKIKNELHQLCNQVIEMVDDKLVQKSADPEMLVFFYKMKGDFCRYKTEFTKGQEMSKAADMAEAAYHKATKLSQEQLQTTNPIRLGLALNFSVFYQLVRKQRDKAIEIAKSEFESALENVSKLDVSRQDETIEVIQEIKQNLKMWEEDNE